MPLVNIGGVHLFYEVRGKGIPIIFIHPPLLTSRNFEYQVDGLSNQFQTIVFDIRGHGNSSYSTQPVTYPLISNDIKHILDYLKINKAFLCGYSTGGSIVFDFLLNYPDRALGGVLLGPMSEVNDWLLKRKISIAAMLSQKRTINLLGLSICYGNANNKQTFKNLYRDAQKGNVKNIRQYYQYSLEYNCTNQLDRISHPILLLYGEKDKQFHHYARLNNQMLPHSELIFVKDAKHQLPTKNSQEINQYITNFAKKKLRQYQPTVHMYG